MRLRLTWTLRKAERNRIDHRSLRSLDLEMSKISCKYKVTIAFAPENANKELSMLNTVATNYIL